MAPPNDFYHFLLHLWIIYLALLFLFDENENLWTPPPPLLADGKDEFFTHPMRRAVRYEPMGLAAAVIGSSAIDMSSYGGGKLKPWHLQSGVLVSQATRCGRCIVASNLPSHERVMLNVSTLLLLSSNITSS